MNFFFDVETHHAQYFPRLQRVDIVTDDGLSTWSWYIKGNYYWVSRPKANVRNVDGKTGEWVCAETSDVYADWYKSYCEFVKEEG